MPTTTTTFPVTITIPAEALTESICCCGPSGGSAGCDAGDNLYLKITVVGGAAPSDCDGEYYYTLPLTTMGEGFIYQLPGTLVIPGMSCGFCGTGFYIRCLENGELWDWHGYIYNNTFDKVSDDPLLLEDGHPTWGLSGICNGVGVWLYLSVSNVPWV